MRKIIRKTLLIFALMLITSGVMAQKYKSFTLDNAPSDAKGLYYSLVQTELVFDVKVEKITEFIGSQKGYPDAYLLPEYVGEESGTSLDIDIADRDVMFREAAEIIVTAQQGSASLLQRKLKLGYNRAGRIIDQLEAAGIVGPFEGSKARSVNITDLASLDHFLNNEKN